jgi:hypothetical protein
MIVGGRSTEHWGVEGWSSERSGTVLRRATVLPASGSEMSATDNNAARTRTTARVGVTWLVTGSVPVSSQQVSWAPGSWIIVCRHKPEGAIEVRDTTRSSPQ